MSTYSDEYVTYMNSPEWRVRRAIALTKARYQCERGCGATATEVNHKTYTRLGQERAEDLEAVCHHCHVVADYERQTVRTPEQAKDRYDARLFGWASRRYGADDSLWPDDVEDDFQRFLELNDEEWEA